MTEEAVQSTEESVTPRVEVQYRRARPADASALFNLLARQHKEAPVPLAPVSEAKSMMVIVQAIRDGRVFLAVVGKKLIGSIALIFEQPWFSDEFEPQDLWWYVLPDYRDTGAGLALLRLAAEEVPNGPLKMTNITAGAERDDRMEPVYKLVLGLQRAGSVYMRGWA